MSNLLTYITLVDCVDILFITFVVYQLFKLFHRTKGFRILIGLFCLAIIYILVRSWGLFLTTWVFQIFWQALIILIIIIFQPEIRDVLAKVNVLDFIQGKKTLSPDSLKIEEVCEAVFNLSSKKIGAIIVLKQKDDLKDLIKGGIPLDAQISEPIIMSIFQKYSHVHDGAIVLDEGRIKTVAGYLPMTERENLPNRYGSRHRASVGLSEKSDAFLIVVSEETGEISVVREGRIKKVSDIKSLETQIKALFLKKKPKESLFRTFFYKIFIQDLTKKGVSFLLVFAFWALLAGQQNYSQNMIVPIEYKKIPPNMELVAPPQNVNITIKGIRKIVSSLRIEDIRLELDISLAQFGKRTFNFSQKDINLPPGIQVIYLEPTMVRLEFKNTSNIEKGIEGIGERYPESAIP